MLKLVIILFFSPPQRLCGQQFACTHLISTPVLVFLGSSDALTRRPCVFGFCAVRPGTKILRSADGKVFDSAPSKINSYHREPNKQSRASVERVRQLSLHLGRAGLQVQLGLLPEQWRDVAFCLRSCN